MQEKILVEIKPDLFPVSFKEVTSGVYFTELKFPTDGVVESMEVVVDSNMLGAVRESPDLFKRLGWFVGPGTTTVHVNVATFAFEQFIGSRDSAQRRLTEFTEHPALVGTFKPGFAASFIADVEKCESDIRRLIGTLAIYLFVMRSLYEEKKKTSVENKIQRWRELFRKDVPKFSLIYLLGQLFLHGQGNSSLFVGNHKIQDWAGEFFATRKEEVTDPGRWVRNRIFDLMPFYNAPALNLQSKGGKPGRLLTATKDVYAAECLYRLFAFYGEQDEDEPWRIIFNKSCLKPKMDPLFDQLANDRLEVQVVKETDRQRIRVDNLCENAFQLLSEERKIDFVRVLDEFSVWAWLKGGEVK